MRVAIYIRVSTEEQALEGYSLPAQEKVLTEYCNARGHEIVNIYRDEGVSAKDIKHRPQLKQLLKDAERKEFDILLVWKLTRLTRSISDLCLICDQLEKHNVAFVSHSESFDCSTAVGRLMRNMLGVFAQWEREVISENVKLAMKERAMQGKCTCSHVLGYDKDGDTLKINEKEADIVAFVYTTYLKEGCIKTVSEICIKKGYKGKRGCDLKPASIQSILTRFVYCGYYSFLGVPYKGNHPLIIDKDTYNRVQKIMTNHSQSRRKTELVFLK